MAVLDLLAPNVETSAPAIFHINSASTGLKFEWHPQTRKVYLIRPVPGTHRADGTLVADSIPNADTAKRVCGAYVMGWKAAQETKETKR